MHNRLHSFVPHPRGAAGGLLRAGAVLLLSAVLTLCLHNASTYRTGSWDSYSEALVFGRMLQMQQDQSAPGGFMGVYTADWGGAENRTWYRDNTPVDPAAYQSYTHQSGLQGWAWGIANKVFSLFADSGLARETALYFCSSMLFYAAVLCVCLAVGRTVGWAAAGLCLLSVCFAPGLQAGMKNLYWCLWLWALPLLAGVVLCAVCARRGRAGAGCYALIFAACLARALCGFEFISAFLILCEAPLVYEWCRTGFGPAWVRRMLRGGAAAVGGVGAALGVWLVQGRLYYGNWAESLQNIAGAAGSRLSVSDGTVREGITAGGVLARYLFADTDPVLQFGGLGVPLRALLGVCAAAIALSLLLWCALGRARLAKNFVPVLALWALGLAAPCSWILLSKAHSDIHTWLIVVLWQFCFVPACAVALGALAKGWCSLLRNKKTLE